MPTAAAERRTRRLLRLAFWPVAGDHLVSAVALALERHRMTTNGGSPPHSVSLIWGGGEG